jgi:glutamate synthase domain-containing protein 2
MGMNHTRFLSMALVALLLILLFGTLFEPLLLWLLPLYGLLLAIAVIDMRQTRHSLRRNFPLFARMRWVLESMRPLVRQYFIESDIDGVPINRQTRGVVYRRAKKDIDTIPFGTKMDPYQPGYEWISHSLRPLHLSQVPENPRVRIACAACTQPYDASLYNISAMSFGALSANAVIALGEGAREGGFFLNTGEGGLTPYHLQTGADLVWQIGTGYFGCRDGEGRFDPERFASHARREPVKMVEIKLSQGAKPGHGGILPADKNTPEIAAIRCVEPHTQVDSPPAHSAFATPLEMMAFIQQLRELSGGKPIGFKLCIGRKAEFIALCQAMVESGITPDFITVDGAEGGTGAAPLEHTNAVGMPLREALVFVSDCLTGFDLKREIRIIAAGKIFTGMEIAKYLALGADLCNSARGFMLALGCIQSLQCHKNRCPTGVATQNPRLAAGLVVSDKKVRVQNFQQQTIHSLREILASAGFQHPDRLRRAHVCQRTDRTHYYRYDDLFTPLKPGVLLDEATIPEGMVKYMAEAGRLGED